MTKFLPTTAKSARATLLAIWFGGFAINIAMIFYVYARGWIEGSSLQGGVKQINDLYAPYLGGIAFYYWGTREDVKEAPQKKNAFDRTGFLFALGASTMWNAMILAFIVPFALFGGTIEQVMDNLKNVIGIFPWLVGGAIGYYFSRPGIPKWEKAS